MAWIEINRLNINSTYPKPPTRTYSFSASKVFIRFIFESLLGFGVHYKTLWLWAHQASRNFCTAVWASGEWHYILQVKTCQTVTSPTWRLGCDHQCDVSSANLEYTLNKLWFQSGYTRIWSHHGNNNHSTTMWQPRLTQWKWDTVKHVKDAQLSTYHYLCICLSVCLSIYWSIYWSIYRSK